MQLLTKTTLINVTAKGGISIRGIGNHEEELELIVDELEEVIAPGQTPQHNETLVADTPDEIELELEELEEVIAPARDRQHNETLVNDTE